MIPIAGISAWMWILILLKADWVRRVNKHAISAADAISCLEKACDPHDSACCPKAGALRFFLDFHFKKAHGPMGEADQLYFEAAVRRQVRELYRHLPFIMALAAAAPLLGLLGTVTGMVETFRVIGLYGMGNAQAMASGIKEALITTQAGLLVAIPGILMGQTLRKKVHGIRNDLLVFHKAVSQWLEKEWQKCSESAR